MTADHSKTANPASRIPMPMSARGPEVYEQVLGLADKIGAACVEAYQAISAAYLEAYQGTAMRGGSLQDGLANQQQPNWASAITSATAAGEPLSNAQELTLEIGENLTDMGVRIGLAYLDAFERATLAAAACHEKLAAATQVDFVKATAAARAELARKVTKAGASTLRELVAA